MNLFLRIALPGLAVTAVAAAVIYFKLLGLVPTALLAATLLLCLFLHSRQSELSKELKAIKARSGNLEVYEQDIHKRLGALEVGLAGIKNGSAGTSGAQNEKLAKLVGLLQHRISAVENGTVTQFEKIPASGPKSIQAQPVAEQTATAVAAKPVELDHINITNALENGGLTMHLQPIVELPTRKPLHYEAFMRLQMKGPQFLDAKQFIKIAEKGGLMPTIDKKVLFSAVRMLRTLEVLNRKAGLFCNISGDTLSDVRVFDEITNFLQANISLSPSLVLEIPQRQLRGMKDADKARLSRLADMGFALSMDQVMDMRLDVDELKNIGFAHLKIPAGILLHSKQDDEAIAASTDLAAALANKGINLIATEVERESDAMGLIDFGVKSAQGNVFAPPRAVKAKLLEGAAPAAQGLQDSAVEQQRVVA
mgnify:CR=1 FL=1